MGQLELDGRQKELTYQIQEKQRYLMKLRNSLNYIELIEMREVAVLVKREIQKYEGEIAALKFDRNAFFDD